MSPYAKREILTAVLLLSLAAGPAMAVPATEIYSDAVTNANNNAKNPSGPPDWRADPDSIITIPDPGGTHGLQYDTGGNVVVRTATAEWKFTANYVGQPDYKIFGVDPNTEGTWVTTGNDFTNFYDTNGDGKTNTDLIKFTQRSLGINDTDTTTQDTIVEFTVAPNNNTIMRATRNPDITTSDPTPYGDGMPFPTDPPSGMVEPPTYGYFQNFYLNWQTTTAPGGSKPFPWTQLGYTYYWGNGKTPPADIDQVQGLSEFLLLAKTPANIYGIYSTASYIYAKNNGQYGNGYASFDVTGDCNTLWAGHRFQAGVSRSAASPNTVTIASGATMAGGQGLLIWSLNYNVTNNGTITGATAKKFGTDTADIAVLFMGDTTSASGDPVTSGVNRLTNAGWIDSPKTAVKSENGDTYITNNLGATIDGTEKAIWLVKGTNTITNYGTITSAGTAIKVDAGTTSIANTGTITGSVVVAADPTAAVDVGSGNVTIGGTYTQGAGSTLRLTADSSTTYGKITATAATLDAASNVYVTTGGTIPNNTTFKVVDTAGAGVGSLPGTISSSSPVFSFAGSIASNDLILTATRANSYSTFAPNANGAAAGAVLNTIAANGTATGDMLTVLDSLDSMTSGQAIGDALESMIPNTDNSIPQATQAGLNQFVMVSVSRLDNFQDPALAEPSSRSENHLDDYVPQTPEIWTQGFGTYIHQDPRASSDGYNATIWGTALGFDLPVRKPLKVGASGGFAQDYIRTKDSSSRTDVDSYQGALYGTYGWERAYIDVLAAFAYNTYDSTRHVAAGMIDRIASGSYNGQQYTGYVGGGYRLDIKELAVTPIASFQYTHLRVNSYQEIGAGALSLNVSAQDTDVAQTGLGVKFARQFDFAAGSLIPELRVKWLYDWIGDDQQLTSTFTGGGGAFTTNGFTPAQSSYDFGAKLTFYTHRNITISANYDFELKEDFYGHYGYAELRYSF